MRKILIWDDISGTKELKKYHLNERKLLSNKVEDLMYIGKFLTFDIKNLDSSTVQQLLHLIERYNYKLYCKEGYHENLSIQIIPKNKINYINNYEDIEDKALDLSNYKKIVHIGDIHGCYDTLKEAWDKHYSNKNFYIFIGDYIDRGKQNVEVVKFLMKIYKLKNVCLLEGNHDRNLYLYSINDLRSYTDIKFKDTRKEIDEEGIKKEQLKKLCKSFKEAIVYTFRGKKVIATHSGVSNFPNKMYEINSEDLIRGKLTDFENVDKLFMKNIGNKDLYQVHGHSNLFNMKPDKFKKSINLEGGIEIGGYLVLCELSENGIKIFKYKNKDSIMINYFK